MKEFWRIVKYGIIVSIAGMIQIGSFTLFIEVVKLPYWASYLISLALSVIWNFTVNRKASFRTDENYAIAMMKVIGYYCVFTPISLFGGNALVGAGWNKYLVEAMCMFVNVVTEYLFMRYYVFAKKIDNTVKPHESVVCKSGHDSDNAQETNSDNSAE